MPIDLKNKLERGVLLTLPNPTYYEIISKYNHLGGIQMQHTDTKNLLPIHIIGWFHEKMNMRVKKKLCDWSHLYVCYTLWPSVISFKKNLSYQQIKKPNWRIPLQWRKFHEICQRET